jgi:hypothetical protein
VSALNCPQLYGNHVDMAAAVKPSSPVAGTNYFLDDRDYYFIQINGPFDLVKGYTTSLDFLVARTIFSIQQARACGLADGREQGA